MKGIFFVSLVVIIMLTLMPVSLVFAKAQQEIKIEMLVAPLMVMGDWSETIERTVTDRGITVHYLVKKPEDDATWWVGGLSATILERVVQNWPSFNLIKTIPDGEKRDLSPYFSSSRYYSYVLGLELGACVKIKSIKGMDVGSLWAVEGGPGRFGFGYNVHVDYQLATHWGTEANCKMGYARLKGVGDLYATIGVGLVYKF